MVKRLMEAYPTLDQMMAETILWDYKEKERQGVAHLEEAEPLQRFETETPEIGAANMSVSDPPAGTSSAAAS